MFNVTVNTVKFQDNDAIKIQSEPVASNTARYRQRQSFGGEKYSGALNYQTAINLNHNALRLRSIRAFEESSQARAAVNRLNEHTINTGLTLQSTPIASLIGLSEEVIEETSERIEQRFELWSNSKNCDMAGNNTLGQMERIEFNNQLVKGDYFAYLHYSTDPRLINPLQIKIITPERICTPYATQYIEQAKRRGNEIVDGVELDENGESIFFYIKSRNKQTGVVEYSQMPKRGPNTNRIMFVHGNRQRFGNEVRGIPALAHIAHELEKITDYSVLELASAIANAAVAMVVKPADDAPASSPFPANGFIPPSIIGAGPDATLNSNNVEHGYTNVGKMVLENSGGLAVSSLNAGEDLKSFDTSRPNVNFTAFTDGMVKYLSASLSIPVEVLNMVFSQNYSASRGALILFWQSLQVWRDEFVSDFLTPVYESFLIGEVATGNLVLPGYDNPGIRAAWNSATWIGVPPPSLDPLKEERASEIRTKHGRTTNEHEAQSRHNTSYRKNIRKLRRENEQKAEANAPLNEVKENGNAIDSP